MRRRLRPSGIAGLAVALVLGGQVVSAQPPTASPGPFEAPWQHVVAPSRSRSLRSEPFGRPAASVRRGSVLPQLWVSSATVAPGEPIVVHLRVTNLGRMPVYHSAYPCEGTEWLAIDARRAVTPGVRQTGNGAAFKDRLVAGALQGFGEPGRPPGLRGTLSVSALADCSMDLPASRYVPLGHGGHRDYRWWWMPSALESSVSPSIVLPLGAGPVTLTATWLRSPGHRFDSRDGWQKRAIRVQVSTTVTLEQPATEVPSVPELADIALADPVFRAWVDGDPSRRSWEDLYLQDWHQPMDAESWDPPPPGRVIEVGLSRWTGRGSLWHGIARVDAVARRVIDVHTECTVSPPCTTPAWADPPWVGLPDPGVHGGPMGRMAARWLRWVIAAATPPLRTASDLIAELLSPVPTRP